MKYFLDQEFIEGFHKPLFGKKRHFIDLISIGIVCEDGREYYAISNEFRTKDADDWVKSNVITKLESKSTFRAGLLTPTMRLSGPIWKSNEQIKYDLLTFFGCYQDHLFWRAIPGAEIYGYYSDYDWVLFCSLFGRMIDLPKGFPMYCIDLKQVLDEKVNKLSNSDFFTEFHKKQTLSFEEKLNLIKTKNVKYPQQTNEHNALADAKWNYELYTFLQTI